MIPSLFPRSNLIMMCCMTACLALTAGCIDVLPVKRHPDPRAPGSAGLPTHPEKLTFPSLKVNLPKPRSVRLPNGIRIFLLENHDIPLCQVRVLVKTGSAWDPPGKEGVHLCLAGVMRLGGTESRSGPDIDAALDAVGADLDLSVESEAFICSYRSRSADLHSGLELIADLLRHPALPNEVLALQRNQIEDGVRRMPEDPRMLADRALRKFVYGTHPYANDGLGTLQSLAAVTREDLVRAHAAGFGPEGLLIGVSGDFSADAVVKDLQRLFSDWPGLAAPLPAIPPVTEEPAGQVVLVPVPLGQSTIKMGHLGPAWGDPKDPAIEAMNWVLGGGGFASRLTERIRSSGGLAYGIRSSFARARERGLFSVFTQTKAESTHRVVAMVLNTLQDFSSHAVPSGEVEAAKTALLENFVFRFDVPSQVVREYMEIEFHGLPEETLETYRVRIASVLPSEIASLAKNLIHPEASVVVVVGDPGRFDGSLDEFAVVQVMTPEALCGLVPPPPADGK